MNPVEESGRGAEQGGENRGGENREGEEEGEGGGENREGGRQKEGGEGAMQWEKDRKKEGRSGVTTEDIRFHLSIMTTLTLPLL